ncbi:baseplate assembly protein [Neisseria animalis]|uniref:Baseplate J/gp47 family protein n=1 Tax=Neisseria animalis TaxID=492 RepID=A0A5P3MPY1_NEIAN|nr:baseplate J/gp47 family protein [Neisseria animalis]QEY23558.1 baseplate J/gp47 family protein [Neisseria animalis]ROW32158.1 baseplate J/gp47 family protein [Neisseria animalis]VEE09216.1 phage baseplate-like protein [Neisseria animalis]
MDLSKLKREDVKAVEDDLAAVLAATIADYEARSGKTLQPAHIERLLINTYAYRETLTRKALNEAYRQQHPRFATGLMLDICGDDVNTPRLQASAARCTIRFSADAAALAGIQTAFIPAGTPVSAGEVSFATAEAAVLTAERPTASVEAVCTQSGAIGNGWSAGQINSLETQPAAGVEIKAANITVPSGGADVESDEDYRRRILLAPESFSVAGPVGAYEYFARAVNQTICDVYVDNPKTADGQPVGGQVRVTVLTKTGMPSEELLNQVREALSAERRRPLCDSVTVAAPTAVDYALDAELVLYTGADPDKVVAAAKSAWAEYEAARREKLGLDIVPLDIQTALKVDGVYNVILRSPTLRVVASGQWARCTSVRITAAAQQQEG